MAGKSPDIADGTVLHRVRGGHVANLRLSPLDAGLTPPGLSVLLGGTPAEAVAQMRAAFPNSKKWKAGALTVGSTTTSAVRKAGFDVIADPTPRFPNHARIIHPQGVAGFDDANLQPLSSGFTDSLGC